VSVTVGEDVLVGVALGIAVLVVVMVAEGVKVGVAVGGAVLVAVAVALGTGRVSVAVAMAGDGSVALGNSGFVGVVRGRMVLTLGGTVVALGMGVRMPAPAVGSGRNRSATNPAT